MPPTKHRQQKIRKKNKPDVRWKWLRSLPTCLLAAAVPSAEKPVVERMVIVRDQRWSSNRYVPCSICFFSGPCIAVTKIHMRIVRKEFCPLPSDSCKETTPYYDIPHYNVEQQAFISWLYTHVFTYPPLTTLGEASAMDCQLSTTNMSFTYSLQPLQLTCKDWDVKQALCCHGGMTGLQWLSSTCGLRSTIQRAFSMHLLTFTAYFPSTIFMPSMWQASQM